MASARDEAAERDQPAAAGLESLRLSLARGLHESWRRGREQHGWRYGAHYDRQARCDPLLADFDRLEASQRERWLIEADTAVREVLQAGYRIVAPDTALAVQSLQSTSLRGLRFRELVDLYQRQREQWRAAPQNFLLLGENLLQRSEPVLAYEVFHSGIDAVEHSARRDEALRLRLLQKSAQALADAHALRESASILAALYAGGARDGETMGLWARVHKRAAIDDGDPQGLSMALQLYSQGYEAALTRGGVDEAIYNGINAATMARLGGRLDTSKAILERVRQLCLDKSERSYWDAASLGESFLLDGELDTAARWYAEAVAAAPLRDRLSMWQQAALICDKLALPDARLRALFAPPRVLVFCGHRLDDAKSDFERFPASQEAQVRSRIVEQVARLDPGFAYCSAVCGSDILFIEAMLEHGGEVHIYLPFPAPQFAEEYVAYAGAGWMARFRAALERADSVTTVSQWDIGLNDKSHAFCNLYVFGAALLRHRNSGCELRGLAVWDGLEDPQHSGTAAIIELWRDYGIEWDCIATGARAHFDAPLESDAGDGESRHTYLPMMFADVKGYSRLSGLQLYIFARRFMDDCAQVLQRHQAGVFATRTQGDSLFVVFRDLEAAVATAREIRDMIAATDWARSGLPADLSARFALDCGPCYAYRDPVTARTELCGAHVIRAARLEPMTPPGHIYASESFATLCAAKKLDVDFEAVGRIVLPKGYGEMRVYHLH